MVTNGRLGVLKVQVEADGTIARNLVMSPSLTNNVAFYRESSTVMWPFVFSRLDLVGMSPCKHPDPANPWFKDDDSILDSSTYPVGEIELVCDDVVAARGPEEDADYKNTFEENKEVHEQANKGIEVHVG